jgi:MarR family transcriptional regulator, 2-MHQ and catechol-resistance regulon repressor
VNRNSVSEDRRESFYHERLKQEGPQYPNFDLPSAQLALHLVYTCEMYHQMTARCFADFGLSKSSLNVLMVLRHCGSEAMQLHELGELLLVSKANITGVIDHLEEKGYVKRVVDAQDRRARYARITKKAETLLDEFIPVHYGNINRLLQGLTEGEKDTLLTLLAKTRESLRANAGNGCADEIMTYAERRE